MKRKTVVAFILAIAMASASGCGSSKVADMYKDALSQAQQDLDEEYQRQLAAMEEATDSESSGTDAPGEMLEETPAVQEPEETEDMEDDGPVKSGTYEVDGIRVTYYASVRNDSTGNWRLGVIYDGSDLNSYVVDYYKFFCRDDSEVHGIVNLGLNTTTLISKVMSDTLEISVMEYQDGEEHDAKLLYSGTELERYWINVETLEVDPIGDDE